MAAEREYRKTMQLDPQNVLGYALFLSVFERHDEALTLIERRIRAQPGDDYVRVNAAWRYLDARQYARAIEQAEQAAGHPDALTVLGTALLANGNTERAIDVFESDLERHGRRPAQLANLAVAYFLSGQQAAGNAILAELERNAQADFLSPELLASVYFAAGDDDRAFANLDRAVEARVRDVIFLRVSEMLDGKREDPRYLELLRAIGIDSRP